MLVIHKIQEISAYSKGTKQAGLTVAFVPTMGYLHAGHIQLIREARKRANRIIVSIFVNPLQFNDSEDLKNYPRNPERDLGLLREEDVDAVFMPEVSQIYTDEKPGTIISNPGLANKLCGISRPGHFEGVLFIVHNLFQWVQPDFAFFGLKDYQQQLMIRKMVNDLAMPVEIFSIPTIREEDGLAMSSRNARLNNSERSRSTLIFQSMMLVQSAIHENKNLTNSDAFLILHNSLHAGLSAEDRIDYFGIYDPQTLELAAADKPALGNLIAIALYIGKVRLIDNLLLV